MKQGSRNIELILISSLITATAIVFVVLVAGTLTDSPQAIMMNLTLLMIFGGLLLVSMILLKIDDKLEQALDAMKEQK